MLVIGKCHKIHCRLLLFSPNSFSSSPDGSIYKCFWPTDPKFNNIKNIICAWKTLTFLFMKWHLMVKLPYFFQTSFIRETDDYCYKYTTEYSIMLEGKQKWYARSYAKEMMHIILILWGCRSWEKQRFIMPLPAIIKKVCVWFMYMWWEAGEVDWKYHGKQNLCQNDLPKTPNLSLFLKLKNVFLCFGCQPLFSLLVTVVWS